MRGVGWCALGLATVTAALLAGQAPSHRRLARALAVALFVDLALGLFGPCLGPAAYAALWACGGVATTCGVVTTLWPRGAPVLGLCVCLGAGALVGLWSGPCRHAGDQAIALLVFHSLTTALQFLALLAHLSRAHRRRSPGVVVSLLALGGDVAALCGPWLRGEPWADWWVWQAQAALVYAVIAVYQGVLWWTIRQQRRASSSASAQSCSLYRSASWR